MNEKLLPDEIKLARQTVMAASLLLASVVAGCAILVVTWLW